MAVFQKSNFSPITGEFSVRSIDTNESREKYLNHPTFGLLYSVCLLDENLELFTTIYAKRLFFLVTTTVTSIKFEPISRTNARIMVENCLRQFQSTGRSYEYEQLQSTYRQTFI